MGISDSMGTTKNILAVANVHSDQEEHIKTKALNSAALAWTGKQSRMPTNRNAAAIAGHVFHVAFLVSLCISPPPCMVFAAELTCRKFRPAVHLRTEESAAGYPSAVVVEC